MKKDIIYLVGFMGVGKTSVGMHLAGLLHWNFLDLDQEIETLEGLPIREIFREKGEAYFRELERQELGRVSLRKNTVVALGGGAFVDDQNRHRIASSGISVWLDASMDAIYMRIAGDPCRPLAASRSEMERLLESRRPYYEQAALRIHVDNLSVERISGQILDRIEALA